jgi:soluble lytic murein transglycosylase-like protein
MQLSQEELDALIIRGSEAFRLDKNLIRAIIMVESSGIPNAIRFEKDWRYFYNVRAFADKLEIPFKEEEKNQATSWGLCQTMGTVARELGFTDKLEMLLIPEIGVFYGCKKLQKLFQSKMCRGDEERVIAAYNAGSPRMTEGGQWENFKYVDKVFRYLREYRKLL